MQLAQIGSDSGDTKKALRGGRLQGQVARIGLAERASRYPMGYERVCAIPKSNRFLIKRSLSQWLRRINNICSQAFIHTVCRSFATQAAFRLINKPVSFSPSSTPPPSRNA